MLCPLQHEAGDVAVMMESRNAKKGQQQEQKGDDDSETEDQLVKVLPSTTSNVPKKFHLQYAGLMAAVSSNVCTDILEKEMTDSQSVMFKKFVIVNYVKQQKEFSFHSYCRWVQCL